jgi:glycosyltransferase involved in cell wall biosynthesis
MRITFVCPPDWRSGGIRVISIYAKRLAQRGHHVTAVVPRPHRPSLRTRIQGILDGGFFSGGRKKKAGVSFFSDVPFEVRWLDHPGPVTEGDVPDADAVIATWWETAEWVWRLSDSKGAKLHFMQDYEIWGAPGGDTSRVDAVCALPMPKIVIASWLSELLQRRWAMKPIALIPNSVESEKFFSVPRGKQGILTVGFILSPMRKKGSDICIAAINRINERVPRLRVISAGMSRPPRTLPLPAGTEFHLEAHDEKLRELYAACDAWLFGTRIEAFGLPILEAMACRTPVIGTPAGAAPELIGQGGGVLVGMEDIDGMAEAIGRIAEMSNEEWRAMSDAAYQISQSYSWERATDQFEAAVASVVSRSGPR